MKITYKGDPPDLPLRRRQAHNNPLPTPQHQIFNQDLKLFR